MCRGSTRAVQTRSAIRCTIWFALRSGSARSIQPYRQRRRRFRKTAMHRRARRRSSTQQASSSAALALGTPRWLILPPRLKSQSARPTPTLPTNARNSRHIRLGGLDRTRRVQSSGAHGTLRSSHPNRPRLSGALRREIYLGIRRTPKLWPSIVDPTTVAWGLVRHWRHDRSPVGDLAWANATQGVSR